MKIKYIITVIIATLALLYSCEKPMEEIYDGIDSSSLSYAVSELEYELTESDYTSMGLAYPNFSNTDSASAYVPGFLADKYKALGKASRVKVTYNFYPGSNEYLYSISNATEYTLDSADYASMGTGGGEPGEYGNFSSSVNPDDFIPSFLDTKYTSVSDNDVYKIFYRYYMGGGVTDTVYSFYYVEDGSFSALPNSYELTSSDYDNMGNPGPGQYGNFSSSVSPADYLSTFLSLNFPYAKADDIILVLYKYYGVGNTETRGDEYQFDGFVWTDISNTYKVTEEYLHNGTAWAVAPDLALIITTKESTIEYTLTNEDYDLVGNGKYNNFDVRVGSAEELESVRVDKINTIIKTNFIDLKAGEVYKVYFEVYTDNFTNETWDLTLEVVEK